MAETLRQPAIILGTKPYGESDVIVTALLKEEGVRRFFARGALKSKKRFGGQLDHFALLELGYVPKSSGLWSLIEVNPVAGEEHGYPVGFSFGLESFAFLGLLAEVIDAFNWEDMPAEQLYHLWLGVVHELAGGANVEPLAERVLKQCLIDFGYGNEEQKSCQDMLNFIQYTLERPLKSAGFFMETCINKDLP